MRFRNTIESSALRVSLEAGPRLADPARGALADPAEAASRAAEATEPHSAVVPNGVVTGALGWMVARIQMEMLPQHPPRVQGLELAGVCQSGNPPAGDIFDFVVDQRGRVTVMVLDVAGRDLGAVLSVAVARAAIRSRAAAGFPPDEALHGAGMALAEELARGGRFVTAVVARYDPAIHRLLFANAGAPAPLHARSADRQVCRLNKAGPPLGVGDGSDYAAVALELEPGDSVLLASDGAVNARNPAGTPFGDRRLAQLAADLAGLAPSTTVSSVQAAVLGHCVSPADDIVIVAMKRQRGEAE
jgi:phosphoserine phosphatase RsbU/P